MFKKLILPILCLAIIPSCQEDKPEIRTACDMTQSGTYLIKWETFPPLAGTVKIYESSNPDSFNLYSPVAEQDINTGFKSVFALRNLSRSYFKLVFNKKYSVVTSARVIPMEGVYNFRDLGGYYNTEKKQTCWGKLYRSSTLSGATRYDKEILDNLNIKTIIDFRTDRESYMYPSKYKAPQVFNLPLRGNRLNLFFDKILSEEMKRGDVMVYLQDVFSFLLENNSDYFIKMFDVLLEEKNYPILFHCSLGKDRSAIAAALILAALEVDQDQIISDYLLSNDQINFNSLVENADMFTPQVQETFTALYSAHRETIIYSFERIVKDYGSMEKYLEDELELTPQKREKLKHLLLYQQID